MPIIEMGPGRFYDTFTGKMYSTRAEAENPSAPTVIKTEKRDGMEYTYYSDGSVSAAKEGGGLTGFLKDAIPELTAQAAAMVMTGNPGIGQTIGASITGAIGVTASSVGGSAALATLNAAIGNTIINTAINGGDVGAALQSTAAQYLGAKAGQYVGQQASAILDSKEGVKLVADIAAAGTRAAVNGTSVADAALGAAVSNATSIATSKIPGFSDLPASVKSAITGSINASIQGKNVDVGDVLVNAAKDGLLTYGLSKLDGFDKLSDKEKSFTTTMLRTALDQGDLSTASVNWAISQANNEMQKAVRSANVIAELKSAGLTSSDSYFDLPADLKNIVDGLSGQAKPIDATKSYVNSLTTTEQEAKDFAKQILGRTPTEFELLELIGLPESNAKSLLETNKNTFDAYELTQAYKDVYGKEPPKGWLESNEAKAMLSSTEAQGKNQLQNYFAQDKNTTNRTEAEAFWKEMGNTGPIPEDALFNMLSGPEKNAKALSETYKIVNDDIKATTFDGTGFKTQQEAQAAAIKNGYNNYNWGDNSYTIMSKEQANQLQKDIAAGKNVGVRPDAFFYPQPGKTLEQQLKEAGNPDEYAYMQGDTIHVVSKRLDVPDYQDIEAWQAFKKEKQDLGGDNFKTFLTEQFSLLEQAMKGAPPDSVKSILANAALFGYGKMAQLVETFSRTGEAVGIPKSQSLTNISRQVQSWTSKLQSQGIQNAEAAVMANVAAVTKESIAAQKGVKPSDISNTELYLQKSLALIKQVKDNPLGASLFIGGEAIQEIPLLVASGGIGSVFKTLIGKSVGLSAAVGTNVALNGAESFGGNYGEVKDYLRKQGLSEAQADAAAVRSGLEAMGVSMLTAYVGDRALIKSFMGDLAKDSFGKVIATNGAREWALGNFEGFMQNASAQVGKYGEFKSMDEALNAGVMEGLAQKGIATGVLTANSLDRVVAKDYSGKDVTFREIIDGKSTFNPATVNKNLDLGGNIKLGDAFDYQSAFQNNPNVTPEEYFFTAQTFRQNGMSDFTPEEISSIVGGASNLAKQDITKLASTFAQDSVVTVDEAKQMMRDLGYTKMTDQEAVALAGKIKQQDALANIQKYVGEKTVTRAEAEQFFKDIGYTPTEAEITQFVRQGADVTEAGIRKEIGTYMASRQDLESRLSGAISDAAAKGLEGDAALKAAIDKVALDAGKTKTDILAQLGATEKSLQDQFSAQLTNVRAQVSNLEKSLSDEIQAARDAGLAGDQALQAGLNSLAAKMGTNQADVLKQLGTTEAALKTQFSTQLTSLDAKLSKAIADAQAAGLAGDAALQSAIAKVASDLGTTKSSVLSQLGKTEAALRTEMDAKFAGVSQQYNALSAAQKATADALVAQGKSMQEAIAAAQAQTASQIAGVEARLTDAIAAAEAMGLSRDQAITAAVDSVAAELGVTKTNLLSQLGKTEATLRAELTSGLAGLSAETKAQYNALTAEQKALATQLAQQGVDLKTAIAQAQQQTAGQIAGLTADVQAKYDSLNAGQKALANQLNQQGVDLRTAIDVAAKQTQQQVLDLGTQLNTRVDELVAQGKTQYEATQQAIAEVNQQNQQLQSLVGTQGRTVTQQDIDALNQMVSGQRQIDLAYDVTGDKQVTQADIDFLTRVVGGQEWTAPAGSAWAPTGLYGQIAASEAQRQADLAEQARQAQEAEKRAATRTLASQAQTQLQSVIGQLPAAYQALQTTTTPIYAGEMTPFDLGSPLDVDFFSPSKEKQGSQTGQQTTKIATGGYLDDLLDLLR